MKNVHNFGIFQPIWLKFGMESLNGRPQHMYMIYMHLSMLTGQTDLPPNQPTGPKVKNLLNFVIFQLIWLKLGTLFSKATGTSKTYIVPKVFTFGYPDWFCLKAHDLPFTHAKFHSSGSSSLAST